MCGIAGFVNKSLNADDAKMKITRMINIIDHRGPDSIGVLIGKNYCAATARLSIEKIKEGHQPIITNNNRYIVSFNGEIFNYKNIIKKYSFSINDINSEIKLLAKLFELKGSKFINDIEGQFAISIYDNFEDKLYLFRDRFGIRPLFYKENNKSFLYASEIKSMGAYSKEVLKTSLNSIASTGLFWSNIDNSTSFEGVKQLQPGFYLTYSKKKIEIKRYWNNPISTNPANNHPRNFIEILKDSLKKQIHGEVGFSSYLSGGIDSSAIAYLLTEIQGSPIDTFSVQFENKEYDESDAQNKIQKIIKSNHCALKVSNEDIANNFEKVITVVFSLELICRFVVTGSKSQFMKDPLNWFDIVSILPLFITLAISSSNQSRSYDDTVVTYVGGLRILRVTRIFKVLRRFQSTQILGLAAARSLKPLIVPLFFLMVAALGMGVLMALAEPCFRQSCQFEDVFNSVYFVLVTVSTVGYGDQVPVTW